MSIHMYAIQRAKVLLFSHSTKYFCKKNKNSCCYLSSDTSTQHFTLPFPQLIILHRHSPTFTTLNRYSPPFTDIHQHPTFTS